MSKIVHIENVCIFEDENLLNSILNNINERQNFLRDLELFFESLINLMKIDIIHGGERRCYQWIYAQKTKEIVDRIKELNLFLRTIQKEMNCLTSTKNFIDEILHLEKINFDNVLNIFNKKVNFLKFYEKGLLLFNDDIDPSEIEFVNKMTENKNYQTYQSKVQIESFEKELAELVNTQIDTRKKIRTKILRIQPSNF